MTVRHDDVWPTIQVKVEKSDSPASVHDGGHRDACNGAALVEACFLVVKMENFSRLILATKKMLKAVLIIVNRVESHAGS